MVKFERTYKENGERRLYALDPKTGKETFFAKSGKWVVRGAVPEDVDSIMKTDGVQSMIKVDAYFKRCSCEAVASATKKFITSKIASVHDDDDEVYFIVERKGQFVAYVTLFTYEERVRFTGATTDLCELNPTHCGIAIYFTDEQKEFLYEEEIVDLFYYLCKKSGFCDHLDLLRIDRSEQIGNQAVNSFTVLRNIYSVEEN